MPANACPNVPNVRIVLAKSATSHQLITAGALPHILTPAHPDAHPGTHAVARRVPGGHSAGIPRARQVRRAAHVAKAPTFLCYAHMPVHSAPDVLSPSLTLVPRRRSSYAEGGYSG